MCTGWREPGGIHGAAAAWPAQTLVPTQEHLGFSPEGLRPVPVVREAAGQPTQRGVPVCSANTPGAAWFSEPERLCKTVDGVDSSISPSQGLRS